MKIITRKMPEFLSGGGEMGERIRRTDWSKTPLGPAENWPQSLKTCVRIVLTSRQPMFVWWGEALINIYNDAYIAIVGGKHPEALGQSAPEVWREIWDEIGPRAEAVMRDNEGTYDEALLLVMERNGYPEETYYTFSYSPVPGDHGGTSGIICANTDDTRRIIGERQLRTLKDVGKNVIDSKTDSEVYEKTLAVLAENPQDFPFAFIYQIKKEGRVAKLVQAERAEIPDTVLPARTRLNELSEDPWLLAQTVRTQEASVVENLQARFGKLPSGAWPQAPDKAFVIPVCQSGQKYPYAILIVGLNPYRRLDEKYEDFFRLVADQIASSVGNVRAYKEERRRAEALAEIDKAKTTFFSNISHEFRTPLTLMLGPVEDILNGAGQGLSPDLRENLESTHRNAMRLLRLVNMLLEFSRIEAGRIEARYQALDLAKLTAELASTFRSVVEKAGIGFPVSCEPVLKEVYVDREMWEKIVLNLLSNAFKYTLKGEIRVTLREENNQAVLKVEDTGIGIPKEELPKMFERFHRVQNAAGRSHEGTGIGLSLVQELVRLHGGRISVESETGVGSIFTVAIPTGKKHLPPGQVFAEESDAPASFLSNVFINEAAGLIVQDRPDGATAAEQTPAREPQPLNGHQAPGIKILLVDDNADMRKYIRHLLEKTYQVETAGHGAEALEKMSDSKPDLIISDIMMPVMDGRKLLETVKKNPDTARIPFILLSARAGEEAKIEGFEAGADDYLIKPFSAKELMSRVHTQIKINKIRTAAERHLENLFIQAPIAICILNGPEYIVELANERMLEILGKTAAQILRRPLFDGVPEGRGQGYEQVLDMVYAGGERFISPESPAALYRAGELKKIYVKYVFEPLRDDTGKITGIMVLADEITEQVNARKTVAEAEERLRLATDGANLATWDLDLTTYALHYSPRMAEIFGHGRSKILTHKDMRAQVHPDDVRPIVEKAFDLALQTGVYDYEARVVWPDRSIHWVRTKGKIVYGEQQEPLRMLGTMMEITDKKMAEEELEKKVEERTKALQESNEKLEKSNYALEQFAFIATHDLQEPLRKIRTFVDLLKKNLHDPDAATKYFEKIVWSSERMSRLINDVLSYARLSNSGLLFADTDLSEILENVKADFELVIEEKKAVIRHGKLPVVPGISLQLGQLFSNLIGNALKFSENNPVIEISSDTPAPEEVAAQPGLNLYRNYVRLKFRDNGIGFDQRYADKIFTIFQRLNNQQYSGTGIGLAICKKIVENHFGSISARGELNKGAVFEVYLPAG